MRAVIGLPVADTVSPWARNSAEYLTAGLRVRDEYAGHPLISTVFAPHAPDKVSDATFARVATLADELDAGIVIDLHESADDIARSVAMHGVRPIERLWRLGLLTPALNAVHMAHATMEEVDLARRTGIAVSLSPSSSIQRERQLPPAAAWAASGIRLGLGSGGGGGARLNQDLWGEMKLLALMTSGLRRTGEADLTAWDALAAGTRGGAAVLGLEGEVGTLERGKWADLCCVDLGGPATQPLLDPVAQLVFSRRPRHRQRRLGGRAPAARRRRIDPPGLAQSGRACRGLGHANEILRYPSCTNPLEMPTPRNSPNSPRWRRAGGTPRALPSPFTTSIPCVCGTSNAR